MAGASPQDRGREVDAWDQFDQQVEHGTSRVAASLGSNGTSADDPLYRPGLKGKAALFATRRYFSLTSTIPALRRKFLRDLEAYRAPDLPEN